MAFAGLFLDGEGAFFGGSGVQGAGGGAARRAQPAAAGFACAFACGRKAAPPWWGQAGGCRGGQGGRQAVRRSRTTPPAGGGGRAPPLRGGAPAGRVPAARGRLGWGLCLRLLALLPEEVAEKREGRDPGGDAEGNPEGGGAGLRDAGAKQGGGQQTG